MDLMSDKLLLRNARRGSDDALSRILEIPCCLSVDLLVHKCIRGPFLAIFNGAGLRMGRQKINPKTQLCHIWPNTNIYFIPEYETSEANVENELII